MHLWSSTNIFFYTKGETKQLKNCYFFKYFHEFSENKDRNINKNLIGGEIPWKALGT